VHTLAALAKAPDALRSKELKALRSVLHPLLEELFAIRKSGGVAQKFENSIRLQQKYQPGEHKMHQVSMIPTSCTLLASESTQCAQSPIIVTYHCYHHRHNYNLNHNNNTIRIHITTDSPHPTSIAHTAHGYTLRATRLHSLLCYISSSHATLSSSHNLVLRTVFHAASSRLRFVTGQQAASGRQW